jgi:hypothetical protein
MDPQAWQEPVIHCFLGFDILAVAKQRHAASEARKSPGGILGHVVRPSACFDGGA